jgi:hypothetical protein
MAAVLTPREQSETGALARRLGGYDEMLRLETELRAVQRQNKTPKLVMDPVTKRRRVIPA